MKRLTIALAAALALPAAAQENIWELPARMVPPEKLEELVSSVAETSPAESGDAWLFSVVSDSAQVSSIINEETETLSAVIVSAPEREYKKNSDAAFGAGVAAGRLLEAAASHPMLQAEMFTPSDELSSEVKEALGIPRENRTVAVVLVAEKAEPSFGEGMGSMEAFSGEESGFDARGAEPRYDERAIARGHERRSERGMQPPRSFDERGGGYYDAEPRYDDRAIARGHERRSEPGMQPPRSFDERGGGYYDAEPRYDDRAIARGHERRSEPGMQPPRGFDERGGGYYDAEPRYDDRVFARGHERRPERGMQPPRGYEGI